MKLYMFRTVPLSIIRSFSLYTWQWYLSYSFLIACEQDQDGYSPCLCYNFLHSYTNHNWWLSKLISTINTRSTRYSIPRNKHHKILSTPSITYSLTYQQNSRKWCTNRINCLSSSCKRNCTCQSITFSIALWPWDRFSL